MSFFEILLDVIRAIQGVLRSIPGLSFVFWLVIVCLVAWVGVVVTRYVLHRVFMVPRSLKKRIIQILVVKEAAKKEEEERAPSKDFKLLIAIAESFYEGLGSVKTKHKFKSYFIGRDDEIALEIVAIDGLIKFFAIIPDHLLYFFEQQLQAQYPSVYIEEVEDYNIFRPRGFVEAAAMRMSAASFLPLRSYRKMDSDPLNALTNALSKIEENEGAMIQIVLRTASKSWRSVGQKVAREMQQGKSLSHAMRSTGGGVIAKAFSGAASGVLDATLKSNQDIKPEREYRLSPLEQDLVKAIEEKASKTGFEANIRVITSTDQLYTAQTHLYNIVNTFAQYTGMESGVQLKKDKYARKANIIRRSLYRVFDEWRTMILTSEELASVYHLPMSITETPRIQWLQSRIAPAPSGLPAEGIILGENVYRGKKTIVRMQPKDRQRHMYVIGTTGSGKTTVMLNMIIQDIRNGNGCCYIDPHGAAIDEILANIPPERADDVILFDPADFERPLGLNMIEFDPRYPEQKTLVISELMAIFDKLYDLKATGGPTFENYMRNAIQLIMEDVDSGATLMEVPKVLSNEEFRRFKLSKTTNPVVYDFWVKEAEKAGGEAALANMVPYISSKLNQFVANDIMRPIIGQQHSAFNVRDVMDEKKILLVKLSKGAIGEFNAYLLGMIIVGKITVAALSRGDITDEAQRHDFFLYIDEFQNFITDSIATILSEARKYHLDLILGHQYINQLSGREGDNKVRNAVFGNVGTIVSYRVGVDDAEMMGKQMAPVFNEFDVLNMPAYTAAIRLMVDGTAARPFSIKMYNSPKGDKKVGEAIRQLSRLKYGRDRTMIESEIRQRTIAGGL